MNATYTQYTLTITPAVGSPIVYTGEAGAGQLEVILGRSDVLFYKNPATGEVSGSYSMNGCCVSFSAIPVEVPVVVTLDPIPCL